MSSRGGYGGRSGGFGNRPVNQGPPDKVLGE